MLFDINKKKLFDKASTEYYKIVKYIQTLYLYKEESFEPLPSLGEVLIETDFYIQSVLFEIAYADGETTDDELHFIFSLTDNTELLTESLQDYRTFFKKTDPETYLAIKDRVFEIAEEIPHFIQLSASRDNIDNTDISYSIVNNLETIFNCLMAIDETSSSKENDIIINKIEKMNAYLYEKGIKKHYTVKKQSNENFTESEHNENYCVSAMNELNSLIGLANVKKDVMATINFIKVNNIRKEKGLKTVPVSNHLVFTGNPGTGKTTVARLLAQIYKELGVISKGQLVETDRAGLIAGYVGQTAIKVNEVVNKARGGILFIDEAYSLTNSASENDFGKEAIDTLVKLMEDYRDDLVVIVAGYTDEMRDFISSNPGLASRFSKYIGFQDYSSNELLEIFKYTCNKANFMLSEAAASEVKKAFEDNMCNNTFGNARGVRNFFDKAIVNQANRVVKLKNANNFMLQTIERDDVLSVEVLKKEEKTNKKIGFMADV